MEMCLYDKEGSILCGLSLVFSIFVLLDFAFGLLDGVLAGEDVGLRVVALHVSLGVVGAGRIVDDGGVVRLLPYLEGLGGPEVLRGVFVEFEHHCIELSAVDQDAEGLGFCLELALECVAFVGELSAWGKGYLGSHWRMME